MATLVRNSVGPYVKTKTEYLHVKRDECVRVLMRSQKPGPQHGCWQSISTHGFEVICASKLQANELIWFVGGKQFPRPAELIKDDDNDDFRYLYWLKQHWFRIDQTHGAVGPFEDVVGPHGETIRNALCRKRMQIMFHLFIRGWKPAAEDVLTGSGVVSTVIEPMLRFRWQGR